MMLNRRVQAQKYLQMELVIRQTWLEPYKTTLNLEGGKAQRLC